MKKTDKPEKNDLFCSFCGKSQHEVKKLIAGPTVFICDECVELCMDIIKEENKTNIVRSKVGVPSPKDICDVLNVKPNTIVESEELIRQLVKLKENSSVEHDGTDEPDTIVRNINDLDKKYNVEES